MPAILLLVEVEPGWIELLPDDWWRRWAWYILRELHLHMSDEDDKPKLELVAMLYRRSATEVQETLVELAIGNSAESRQLLASLLEAVDSVADGELDQRFCSLIASGSITPDRVGEIAQFVLARDAERASVACLTQLNGPKTP